MKIRTAIFGIYVTASAVGFAVLMRFMLAEVRPRYVASLRSSMSDSARLLAAALENQVPTTQLAQTTTGLKLRVITIDGRVLVSSTTDDGTAASPYAADGARRELAQRMGSRILDEAQPLTEEALRVTAPVTLQGGQRALVELSRPLRSVDAFIWSERKKLAGVSLLIAAAMLVAGWVLAARLTRSLERLTMYVQRARDGIRENPPTSRAAEIAALTRAFEEMREAIEGRQHAERYTQSLAHEVKAPLAAIRGAAELMDENMPAETRRRFLGNIRTEAARIQQIIERLLELSSLEARKTLQQAEVMAASELVKEAVAVVASAGQARGVAIRLTGAPAVTLSGERVLLREALVNLLQNAVEFSPVGGEVRIRHDDTDEIVEFVVEDDGPGIPDYAVARVFERFYSLPRPDTQRKSTGLGLTLVREIAQLHGGDVAISNRESGGARAVLKLRARPGSRGDVAHR